MSLSGTIQHFVYSFLSSCDFKYILDSIVQWITLCMRDVQKKNLCLNWKKGKTSFVSDIILLMCTHFILHFNNLHLDWDIYLNWGTSFCIPSLWIGAACDISHLCANSLASSWLVKRWLVWNLLKCKNMWKSLSAKSGL